KEGFDRAYASCMNARGYYTGPAVAMAPPPPPPAPVVVAPPPPQVVIVPQPPPVIVHQPPPVVLVEPRRVHIPPGHYSPPGSGRVCYPGRPPGQQPNPFPCHKPVAVPAGAFILYKGVAWDSDYAWRPASRGH